MLDHIQAVLHSNYNQSWTPLKVLEKVHFGISST